jgi:hypothetical protein
MAKNIFTVDYDARVVDIVFKGEAFQFDLTEGDVGDFWSGFVMKDGSEWDVNFYQEDETMNPSTSVYPAVWVGDENGSFEIDTNNGEELEFEEEWGDRKNYFTSIVTTDVEDIKYKLALLLTKINACGIGAWNADLENTIEAVALEDYYGDVESDEPTVKYNGWYEDLEKLVSSI